MTGIEFTSGYIENRAETAPIESTRRKKRIDRDALEQRDESDLRYSADV